MKYIVIHELVWNCRLISVSQHPMRTGQSFVLGKFGKYDSGEFLFSDIYNEAVYGMLYGDMQAKKLHTIHRYLLQLDEEAYHLLTWADVDRGICSREKIGEVQRDQFGNPIKSDKIVVYAHLDNRPSPDIIKILQKEYIAVSSPAAQKALEFNNEIHFKAKLDERRRQREQEEENWLSSAYDAYEEHKYDNIDLTPEEQVMNALENGEGERFGY